MASGAYNAGATGIANQSIDFLNDDIVVLLIGKATPYTFDPDHATLAAINASELNVGGYGPGFAGSGRKLLTSKTIATDAVNNRTVYDAADPSTWTLAVGDDVAGAVIAKKGTSDADSIPLWWLDTTDLPTNTSTFLLAFNNSGTGIHYNQNG